MPLRGISDKSGDVHAAFLLEGMIAFLGALITAIYRMIT